jgi:hypothetical protein
MGRYKQPRRFSTPQAISNLNNPGVILHVNILCADLIQGNCFIGRLSTKAVATVLPLCDKIGDDKYGSYYKLKSQ